MSGQDVHLEIVSVKSLSTEMRDLRLRQKRGIQQPGVLPVPLRIAVLFSLQFFPFSLGLQTIFFRRVFMYFHTGEIGFYR